MNASRSEGNIRVLIADDDEMILDCYRDAFQEPDLDKTSSRLHALSDELFAPAPDAAEAPKFDVVVCSQGDQAIAIAEEAVKGGRPFDVVILDVRMPPGVDGVRAGQRIRGLDPEVEIVFVTGYSDFSGAEMARRVPPPMKLHCFKKPLSFTQLARDVAAMVRNG